MRGLVTLGPALDAAGLHGAPHDVVRREAAAVVCHGGHGTVVRALTHRLPLLCLPMGRDQDDNAARVTARGAGLALPQDAPVGAIRNVLRQLVDDPALRAAARKLGDAVAAEAASSTVMQELEALAGAGQGCS